MDSRAHLEVDVCVVGLGVSSLALLRKLLQQGTSFVVVSDEAFGIWRALAELGEDFDLLSSNLLASYSWWEVEDDFHFQSASEYYARLEAELSDELRERWLRARTSHYRQREDGGYDVYLEGREGPALSCAELVITVGQSIDSRAICTALQQSLALRGKTVFIDGYGDTSNMLIARLMLGDNEVICSSAHFQNLDKVFRSGPGPTDWAPLDSFEPYEYLQRNNYERSKRSFLCVAMSPYYDGSWLSRVFRRQSGLDDLFRTADFRRELPSPVKSFWLRQGISAGFGYPVKYWPVEAYFDYLDNGYAERMLSQRMLLNDIYYFMMLGRVRVVHPSQVEWISKGECAVNGESVEVDFRLTSGMARPREIELTDVLGGSWCYAYDRCLHGVWSAEQPHVYFLGGERPTSGAFAATAEIQCEFVLQMLNDADYAARLGESFDSRMRSWKYNFHESGQGFEALKHTQFTGVTNQQLSQLMGRGRGFLSSVRAGELVEYLSGPCVPSRYPEITDASESYLAYCRKWTNSMFPGLVAKLAWVPLLALNLIVLGLGGVPALCGLGLLLLLPRAQKLVKCLVYDVFSFGEDGGLYRRLSWLFAACAAVNGYRAWAGVQSAPFELVLGSGIPLALLLVMVSIYRTYAHGRLLFNDLRGKESYLERHEEYLERVRKQAWYRELELDSES